jgi:hypothetical protein
MRERAEIEMKSARRTVRRDSEGERCFDDRSLESERRKRMSRKAGLDRRCDLERMSGDSSGHYGETTSK